jgi:hypothetical protein
MCVCVHNSDVIVLFYNPGCAHCAAAVDPFTRLAQRIVSADVADAITVVRFDVSAHEPPAHVHFHGVPTVMFFAANAVGDAGVTGNSAAKVPVEFDGDVTNALELYDFVLARSSFPALLPKVTDGERYR